MLTIFTHIMYFYKFLLIENSFRRIHHPVFTFKSGSARDETTDRCIYKCKQTLAYPFRFPVRWFIDKDAFYDDNRRSYDLKYVVLHFPSRFYIKTQLWYSGSLNGFAFR